jgi:cytochrome c2
MWPSNRAGALAVAAATLAIAAGALAWDRWGARLEVVARASALTGGGDPDRGEAAIERHACGACHRIPGVSGASASVGPALSGFARRTFIAGQRRNTPTNLVEFLAEPHAVAPGTAMPDVGATPEEIRDIAAYLYTL